MWTLTYGTRGHPTPPCSPWRKPETLVTVALAESPNRTGCFLNPTECGLRVCPTQRLEEGMTCGSGDWREGGMEHGKHRPSQVLSLKGPPHLCSFELRQSSHGTTLLRYSCPVNKNFINLPNSPVRFMEQRPEQQGDSTKEGFIHSPLQQNSTRDRAACPRFSMGG